LLNWLPLMATIYHRIKSMDGGEHHPHYKMAKAVHSHVDSILPTHKASINVAKQKYTIIRSDVIDLTTHLEVGTRPHVTSNTTMSIKQE
jgi:hypothetical protein